MEQLVGGEDEHARTVQSSRFKVQSLLRTLNFEL
jgi:hypothetical protein